MKINKIDPVCVAVKNLDTARKIWEPVLGKTAPDDWGCTAFSQQWICVYSSWKNEQGAGGAHDGQLNEVSE